MCVCVWGGGVVVCVCVWGGVCVCVCVLFFLQNVRFPNHISRVRLNFFFLSRRLVKFFAFFHFCFYFILFCFVFSNSNVKLH